VTPRKRKRCIGDVPLDQLAREVDVAYRAWCERRGLLSVRPDPVFSATPVYRAPEMALAPTRGRRGISNPRLNEVASALVAMGKPPRVLMRRMAIENGLVYSSLATLVSIKRGRRPVRRMAA
jgi:hypothetical protein